MGNAKRILLCVTSVIVILFVILLAICLLPIYEYHQISVDKVEILVRTHKLTGKTAVFNPFTGEWYEACNSIKTANEHKADTEPKKQNINTEQSPNTDNRNALDIIYERKLKEEGDLEKQLKIIDIEIAICERGLENPSQYSNKEDTSLLFLKRKGATEEEINELKIMEIEKRLKGLKEQKQELEKKMSEQGGQHE